MYFLFQDIERNRNLTMMVCKTADECAVNAGEVCTFYPGPQVDLTLPVDLQCDRTIAGRYLRVRQQMTSGSWLSICECVIYSH